MDRVNGTNDSDTRIGLLHMQAEIHLLDRNPVSEVVVFAARVSSVNELANLGRVYQNSCYKKREQA